MLIHDDIFTWEGFGGVLRLGSGQCRLRIFDLRKGKVKGLAHLKPYVVVAADVPESRMSVRSCVSHIATRVSAVFNISPQRMVFVEYYPPSRYGPQNENLIAERYDMVDFVWHGDKAMHPKWRPLKDPLLQTVRELMQTGQPNSV
jgi:hypothetical protein